MASNIIGNAGHVQDEHLDERTASIEKLPDECILSIFDYLAREDLCALTLVSKRFNGLANRSIRLLFSKREVYIGRYPSLKLQIFGSSITNLCIDLDASEEIMEEILCKLCPNVTTLILKSIPVGAISQPYFREILSKLVELHIEKLLEPRS